MSNEQQGTKHAQTSSNLSITFAFRVITLLRNSPIALNVLVHRERCKSITYQREAVYERETVYQREAVHQREAVCQRETVYLVCGESCKSIPQHVPSMPLIKNESTSGCNSRNMLYACVRLLLIIYYILLAS